MATAVHKTYVLAEFTLEPDKRLLAHAGTPVHLAHRPFQVLLYLIENRERVVTRQELLERFWEGHDVYEVALSKCVGAIRKALQDQLERPRFIETRWAEGYRYVGPMEEQLVENGSSLIEIEKTRGLKIVVEEESEGFPAELEKVVTAELEKVAPPAPSTVPLPLPRTSSRPARKLLLFAACALLVLAAGALLLSRQRANSRPRQPVPLDSVAVLPLKNLTGDPAHEYFSDGMTESLITALSRIDGLKVISRGSAFRYKGKEVDPQEVGQQLKVASLLEGGVRRDGDSVRVAVRLVSTADGRILWVNESYDRKIQDIFGLQDEIARNVVAGLRVKLNEEGARRLTKRYTENPDAYQLYILGQHYFHQQTKEAFEKSIEYYEQAIEKDPNYALAYTGLARSYHWMGSRGFWPTKESEQKVEWATLKALQIDDTLVEGHVRLGGLKFNKFDWAGAEKEIKWALDLDPNSPEANEVYFRYLANIGRPDEALQYAIRTQELGSTPEPGQLAFAYLLTRQYDKAIELYRKAIEKKPDNPHPHILLGEAYVAKGMYEEGVAEMQKGVALDATLAQTPERWDRYPMLAYAYAMAGRRDEALKILDAQKELARQRYVSPYNFAIIYTGLGDKDLAFAWLEKCVEQRTRLIHRLKVRPKFDSLRSDPRYAVLLRRMNLEP